LHENVGIRFPIYILITKSDLLAGFMEFFGEYGKEERAQVWGVSFPYTAQETAGAPFSGLAVELDLLEKRLNERLIDRVQQERDPSKRAAIYGFPQQWAALKDVLSEFLGTVFQPSRFEERPLVRGAYFTSGTQEGTPIDRAFGALGRALRLSHRALAPQRASGRSFFLTKLLKDVVFREADLAGTNLRWERHRAVLQWGAIAAAAVFTIGAILAWSVSYTLNKTYVADVNARAATVAKHLDTLQRSGGTNVVTLLPTLQAVDQGVAGHRSRRAVSMGFGLFQGKAYEARAHTSACAKLSCRAS
jgi:type VI secretion system protein ImpL